MFRRMRDPRLAEIDFLMDVEQRGVAKVRGMNSDEQQRFGLDAGRFRDMVFGLLLAGHLSGGRLRSDSGSMSSVYLEGEREQLLRSLGAGQPIDVLLSHSGRVHMWTLRDALLRDADLEPMGLKNKAAWERDLFLRLRWATASEPLAIIIMDLDNFGIVNKQLGMAVGDDVLRAAFGLTKNLVGSRGAVYRYGGEEVGILIPGTQLPAATAIANELRAALETEVVRQVPVLGRAQTASIGVATFSETLEPRAAVEYVDVLMRQSKQSGKNAVTSKTYGS